MNTQAEKKLKEARQSAGRAVAEGRDAVRSTVEAGREQVGDLRDGAKDSYTKAAAAVESRFTGARKSFTGVVDDTGSYVREHPVAALSLAWSCGLLPGFLIHRRNDNGA